MCGVSLTLQVFAFLSHTGSAILVGCSVKVMNVCAVGNTILMNLMCIFVNAARLKMMEEGNRWEDRQVSQFLNWLAMLCKGRGAS